MRVLVCGSRDWSDWRRIDAVLRELVLADDVTLVHGGARGADALAHQVGVVRGWNIERFPARWNVDGRAAGFVRNVEMLRTDPHLVVGFKERLSSGLVSGGTEHMLKISMNQVRPVVWVSSSQVVRLDTGEVLF